MRKLYESNNYVSEKKMHFTISLDNKYPARLFNDLLKPGVQKFTKSVKMRSSWENITAKHAREFSGLDADV